MPPLPISETISYWPSVLPGVIFASGSRAAHDQRQPSHKIHLLRPICQFRTTVIGDAGAATASAASALIRNRSHQGWLPIENRGDQTCLTLPLERLLPGDHFVDDR